MTDIKLGDQVAFDKVLVRTVRQWDKTWGESSITPQRGLVVGKRHTCDGRTEGGFNEPMYWEPRPGTTRHYYLVATDLYRKPYRVPVENVRKIDD